MLDFPSDFPFSLPKAILKNNEFIGKIPHVDYYGTICVEESDTILIDYTKEKDVLRYFLKEVFSLLDTKYLKSFQDELTDEYEGYFPYETKEINSFYNPKKYAEKIALQIGEKNYSSKVTPFLMYDDNRGLPPSFSNVNKANYQKINILHVPLYKEIVPPSPEEIDSGLGSYIQKIHGLINYDDMEYINKFINRRPSKKYNFFILFSMPRTSGEKTQILVQYYSKKKNEYPLRNMSESFEINLYLINRHTESYLKERGGGDNNLSPKKVSIIGCGSVGGEIALMLAKAGIGKLTLIDYDRLTADNIYRHRLGGASLNYIPDEKKSKFKVDLLAQYIKANIPYIYINAKPKSFLNLISNESNILTTSDIVIVAIGAPTESIKINLKLKELGVQKVIYCWNEADSVGGHSVALDLTKSCYECLYTDETGFTLQNELAFVENGQKISKNLIGCRGVFTPFSYLDSLQTALLASKQCVEMLTNELDSQAMSWKASGPIRLKVTDRFNECGFQKSKDLVQKEECRVCNG